MRITIIGSGYVGLVSGACLAEAGHHVTCVDTDADKIAGLKEDRLPIYEPGLDPLVARNRIAGRLDFATDLGPAVAASAAVFIAVGTPERESDGHADVSYVEGAAAEIARHLAGYTVVATKSTVPVGTGDRVERIIGALAPEADVSVVSNPEFLREGEAIADFQRPDRVVVGVDGPRAEAVMREIYAPFCANAAPFLVMRRRSSEIAKYAANAFLATKVTFVNEVANLCEEIGADIGEVAQAIGLDRRIGPDFLSPGPGFGGSCFPKDTLAFVRTGQEFGAYQTIVESVVVANNDRKRAMGARVVAALGADCTGKTVAMLGVTFKPDTDDVRASPALDVIQAIEHAGGRVRAYDPQGMAQAAELAPDVTFCETAYDAMTGSDIVVLVTDWAEFRGLDLNRIGALVPTGVVVDLRNMYDPQAMAAADLSYSRLGR